MNKQEAFNKAYLGLKSQGFQKSLYDGVEGICAYRGKLGLKCAVGHIISDEEYRVEYDDWALGVTDVISRCPSLAGLAVHFLIDIQRAHDRSAISKNMEEMLHDVAVKYALTVPE